MIAFRQPTCREERRDGSRRQLSRELSANLSLTKLGRPLGLSVTTVYYWKKGVLDLVGSLDRMPESKV